jgi:hypothetical protein
LRGLKAILRPAKRKLLGPVPRAAKDYATHIPALLALAQAIKVEKVLELGCGQYSTLTFLNAVAFPALLSLESLETDQAWLDKISATVDNDLRVQTRLVRGTMRSVIEQTDLDDYDLILVDDSTSSEERSATISAISARRLEKAVVAIHDFEIEAYRGAASAFQHQFVFKAFNPQTGIVWNGEKNLSKALSRTASTMKRYAANIEPDDINGWRSVLAV